MGVFAILVSMGVFAILISMGVPYAQAIDAPSLEASIRWYLVMIGLLDAEGAA
jgi:hypothetical protein